MKIYIKTRNRSIQDFDFFKPVCKKLTRGISPFVRPVCLRKNGKLLVNHTEKTLKVLISTNQSIILKSEYSNLIKHNQLTLYGKVVAKEDVN